MPSLADLIDPDADMDVPLGLRGLLAAVEVPAVAVPAIRTRYCALGGWGFSRTETSGHVSLGWTGKADLAEAYHWLIVSSSGEAGGPAMAFGGTRNAALIAGTRLAPSLRLSGTNRHVIVHVPAVCIPSELADGVPFESESGAGGVLAQMVRVVEREARTLSAAEADAITAVLTGLLHKVLSERADAAPVRPRAATIDRIIDHLEMHCDDPDLVARAVARACGLSLRQLHRAFAAQGESFAAMLRRMRFARALAMLEQGGEPIGTIAAATGFSSPDYFATAFRKRFGCTPRAWREARRKA